MHSRFTFYRYSTQRVCTPTKHNKASESKSKYSIKHTITKRIKLKNKINHRPPR
uniref:Uncharacterized protein n=1 Tax=Rhizophora mucronata TaxID=61149 RepID=A0A2P2QED1_RHIMU